VSLYAEGEQVYAHRPLRRTQHLAGDRRPRIDLRRSFLLAAGVLTCLILAYILDTRGMTYALLAVALPLAVWWVIRRPGNGLLGAVAALLVLPYWYAHIWLVVPTLGALGLVRGIARSRLRALDCVMFLLVSAFIASWALHRSLGVPSRWFIQGILPFGLYAWARLSLTERLLARVQWVILLAGAVGACTVLYEAASGHAIFIDPLTYEWKGSISSIFRAGGVFGGAPTAATALAMVFLVSAPLVRGHRRAVGALLLVILAGMLVTFDRAGLLGLIGGGVVFAVLLPYRRWGRVALVAFALCIAAYAVTTSSSTLASLSTSKLVSRGIIRSNTIQARSALASSAFQVIGETTSSIAFGHGFDVFFGRGALPETVAQEPYLRQSGGPNDEYLRALLEQGIVGLALELAWLLGSVYLGVRTCLRIDPGSSRRAITAGLTAATVCFLLAAAGHDMAHNVAALSVAALMTGLLVSVCSLPWQSPPHQPERDCSAEGWIGASANTNSRAG